MSLNARLAAQTLAGVVIAATAVLLFPLFGTTAVRGVQTKNLSNAKQLATGCRLYASDHQGRFPIHLSELEPDYIPDVASMACAVVTNGKDAGERMDWLYFGAGFSEAKPPAILIASPQMIRPKESPGTSDGQRIYIEGDTSGSVAREIDYQKLLAETRKQMQAMDEVRRAEMPSETPPKLPEN